jgi:hypothetical protein
MRNTAAARFPIAGTSEAEAVILRGTRDAAFTHERAYEL